MNVTCHSRRLVCSRERDVCEFHNTCTLYRYMYMSVRRAGERGAEARLLFVARFRGLAALFLAAESGAGVGSRGGRAVVVLPAAGSCHAGLRSSPAQSPAAAAATRHVSISRLHHASITPPSRLHHAITPPLRHHASITPPSRLHRASITPPSRLHYASITPPSRLHHASIRTPYHASITPCQSLAFY